MMPIRAEPSGQYGFQEKRIRKCIFSCTEFLKFRCWSLTLFAQLRLDQTKVRAWARSGVSRCGVALKVLSIS